MAADSCRAAKHFRSSENEARLPVFVTYSIITLLGQKSANNVFTADPPPCILYTGKRIPRSTAAYQHAYGQLHVFKCRLADGVSFNKTVICHDRFE